MGTSRPNGSLYTKIEGAVAQVEFGHPASNSFVMELLDRLAAEIGKLSENPDVKVIVLKSEGDRAFCAGASFDELVQIASLEEGKRFFGGFAKVINAMRSCSVPIIGRVQGKAVGGGVGLIAACDYVLATEQAAVRLSEISIGIAPLVIAPAVERKIGKAALAELAFSPTEWKNAYWAHDKGLFSKVYDNIKELDKELDFFVSQLAKYQRTALEAMTKVLWEGTEHWITLLENRAEMSGKLGLSPDTKRILERIKKKS
ncbi:enoyl-CoA hydratase/isomerase family protein [Lentiprolixibacter aurantiacus]|uniref:Enoyl-CoA hydratase/isomerase family protein n=1 Tax=Lentiprolixibacter aurantiacus TaxID=2993939 RepID=A0AAE3MJE4_9FLAO|nr:enoyl-CoA hydratase/isomerase family protein [Lentiprolixibacter aurantiacus]MCX2718401.1 enoyl-CoA hydratase/isomerase family protein [Lentiprolixibacter aurantiacus]